MSEYIKKILKSPKLTTIVVGTTFVILLLIISISGHRHLSDGAYYRNEEQKMDQIKDNANVDGSSENS